MVITRFSASPDHYILVYLPIQAFFPASRCHRAALRDLSHGEKMRNSSAFDLVRFVFHLVFARTHPCVGGTNEAGGRGITSVSVQEQIADCADVYLLRVTHPPWQARTYSVVGTPPAADDAFWQDFLANRRFATLCGRG